MPSQSHARLRSALFAFERFRSPVGILHAIRDGGLGSVQDGWDDPSPEVTTRVDMLAEKLWEMGVGVLVVGDEEYPARLADLPVPPAVLFYAGNLSLLNKPGIGMCGSRNASAEGLAAANACGEVVAKRGWNVVSGYAKGVDSEAHLAALAAGGSTVMVLAEGFSHFRMKRSFRDQSDPSRYLAVSQFHPGRPWNVGAAMSRNGLIAGLSRGLVVIEAKESGGTLDAGLRAIEMGRPVLALEFSAGSPKGNDILFSRGAYRVTSRRSLAVAIDALAEGNEPGEGQLNLALE